MCSAQRPTVEMSDCVSTMILLLLCTGISAAIEGPSPQTLLVPHGVNAIVQFTCSDEPLSGGAVGRFWFWTMLGETYTSSRNPRPTVVSVVNSANDSNDELDAQSTLTISSVDDIVQSPIDSINVTCTRQLIIPGSPQEHSSTATLVTFGPLQQPTVSHNTSSVLVQWMPPLLWYDLHYRLVIPSPSNNTTLCLNSTSDSTEYTVDPSALGDGCSTVNCTMYRVTVTAVGNGGEGQPATSEPFIFPTGTPNGWIWCDLVNMILWYNTKNHGHIIRFYC